MITDLQNQQAAVTAQNPAPILASVLAPASTPRPPKVYIVKLSNFNSNNYNTFK